LNSQAQGVSGKNKQSTQTPWRGSQCGCIGSRPALITSLINSPSGKQKQKFLKHI